MYIDASDASFDDCTTLSFNFKEPEPTRTWNVTIIQIPCDYGNKAPPGCLQYYFGLTDGDARGIIQSFNFAGKIIPIYNIISSITIHFNFFQEDFTLLIKISSFVSGTIHIFYQKVYYVSDAGR